MPAFDRQQAAEKVFREDRSLRALIKSQSFLTQRVNILELWRLIIDPPMEGAENMAVDEAILAVSGRLTPALRFYGWKRPTISIGCLQDPSPFIGAGLPIVRRITGGRAVIHDIELTYSVIAPSMHPLFSGGIMDAYRVISCCIRAALNDVGLYTTVAARRPGGEKSKACFQTPSRFETLVEGKKLVGSSQRRFKDAFLQHGSILFGLNEDLNARVFGSGILEKTAYIRAFKPVEIGAFQDVLVKRFSEGFNAAFKESLLTDEETRLKEELVERKYSRDEWNLRRGFAERIAYAP